MRRKPPGFKFWPVLALLAVALVLAARGRSIPMVTAATTWNVGDVFVAVNNGQYKVYDNNGNFKETISDGLGGFPTGCAFNPDRTKLYTTNFAATRVKVYNRASPHTIVQTIDTSAQSPGGHSESIVFAPDGSFYVGHADGDRDIHKYNAAGVFQTKFNVATGPRGSDWIDLAVDQKTMFYTSEGGLIRRYDVSGAGAQLADFANIGGEAFALRLLPPGDGSGGLLVARRDSIKKLDDTGAVVASWDATGQDVWFSLSLDPDGQHFWAGNLPTGNFYKFRLNTPGINTQVLTLNTGASFGTPGGICVLGRDVTPGPPGQERRSISIHAESGVLPNLVNNVSIDAALTIIGKDKARVDTIKFTVEVPGLRCFAQAVARVVQIHSQGELVWEPDSVPPTIFFGPGFFPDTKSELIFSEERPPVFVTRGDAYIRVAFTTDLLALLPPPFDFCTPGDPSSTYPGELKLSIP